MGKLNFGGTGENGLSYEPKLPNVTVGAPLCPRCKARVYFNEEKRALGNVWHTRCFNCKKCRKNLDSTNCAEHDGEVYCNACHRREFGPKGYGYAGGAAGVMGHGSSSSDTGNALRKVSTILPAKPSAKEFVVPTDPDNRDICRRCNSRVYFAEEMIALGRKWHKLCFKCGVCGKMLQPGSCNDGKNELLCNYCYQRMYGPKGYGYAGGAGNLFISTENNPSRVSKSIAYARASSTPSQMEYNIDETSRAFLARKSSTPKSSIGASSIDRDHSADYNVEKVINDLDKSSISSSNSPVCDNSTNKSPKIPFTHPLTIKNPTVFEDSHHDSGIDDDISEQLSPTYNGNLENTSKDLNNERQFYESYNSTGSRERNEENSFLSEKDSCGDNSLSYADSNNYSFSSNISDNSYPLSHEYEYNTNNNNKNVDIHYKNSYVPVVATPAYDITVSSIASRAVPAPVEIPFHTEGRNSSHLNGNSSAYM